MQKTYFYSVQLIGLSLVVVLPKQSINHETTSWIGFAAKEKFTSTAESHNIRIYLNDGDYGFMKILQIDNTCSHINLVGCYAKLDILI